MARRCGKCGSEVADLARFCSNCGAPLIDLTSETGTIATGTLEAPVGATGPLGSVSPGVVSGVPVGTALLIVRRGPGEGTTFTLDSDLITVGRADDAALMLDDVTVSRRHAQITREADGWRLTDVGSLNGTYVNRDRINSAILHGGDELQIGKYRFVFLVAQGGQA